MKLLIAIIQDDDATRLVKAVMKEGFSVTKLSTTGGFLRAGNTTLLLGVEDDRVDDCLAVIKRVCSSRKQLINANATPFLSPEIMASGSELEVTIGGATVFVLPIEKFEKY